jgi:hypothetical protein
VCARCGNFTCVECRVERADGVFCADCAERLPEAADPLPWEKPGAGAGALFSTMAAVLRGGPALWPRVAQPERAGWKRPFAFYVLVAVPCGIVAQLVRVLVETKLGHTFTRSELAIMAASITVGWALFPLVVGFYHVGVALVGGRGGFHGTFRIMSYVYGAVAPFNIVPYLGAVISLVTSFVLLYRGYKAVHGLTPGRAAIALFLVPVGLCVLIAVLITAVIAAVVFAIQYW